MTQLRELFVKVDIKVGDALKTLSNVDKLLKKISAQSRATRKQVKATGDQFKKSARDAVKANKATKKSTKDVGTEVKKTSKDVKEAAKVAKKAEAERKKAAKDAEKAIKSAAKASAKAAKAKEKEVKEAGKRRDKAVASSKAALAVVTGAAIAAQVAVLGFVNAFATRGADISKQAQVFDLTTNAVQRLQGAAKLTGVDFDEVTDGLKEFRVKTQEAKEDGVTPFSEALLQLGLDFKAVEKLRPEAKLKLIADRMQTLAPTVDRNTILMRLFGEEAGIRMAPLLNKGSKGIDKIIGRFIELGGVMDKDAIQQAKKVKRQFNELSVIGTSVANMVGEELSPVVIEVAKELAEWALANGDVAKSELIDFLKKLIRFTGDAIPKIVKLADGMLDLTEKVGGVEGAITVLGTSMLAFKLLAIPVVGPWIAGFTALLGLVHAFNLSMDESAKNKDRLIAKAIDAPEFRKKKQFTTEQLLKTQSGQKVLRLEAQRAVVTKRLNQLGGKGQSQARREARQHVDIQEFSQEDPDDALGDVAKRQEASEVLAAENARIDRAIEKSLKAFSKETGIAPAAPVAATPDTGPAAPESKATEAQRRRQSDLASKKIIEGKLSKGEEAEFQKLLKILDIEEPEDKKDKKGKKKKKKKTKKETFADILGVKDPKKAARIGSAQPRGLSTVIQNFNIKNQISIPAVQVTINGVRGTAQQVARAGAELGSSINDILGNAARASVTQVLG